MTKEKFNLSAEICKFHNEFRIAIENDESYCECLNSYMNLVLDLNNGLVELNADKLKESVVNEVSIIIIIVKLLKLNYSNKLKSIKLNEIVEKFDKNEFFTCHDEKIFDPLNIGNLNVENLTYEEIIDLFPQRQTLSDKKLFGQYYTPNYMVDHVLTMLDMKKNEVIGYKIVDPACGNGAFLIKVIDKLFKFGFSLETICNFVNTQLFGFDSNPSAVFLCKLSIYLKLLSCCNSDAEYVYIFNNINLNNIKNINTITTSIDEKFNIILGNPPYFKIKNSLFGNKSEYSKILNGQGNIYVLFMQWALLHIEAKGNICLIVPQSFRSGKYFKNIRKELCNYSLKEILTIDSKNRNQVFSDAEQAILIMNLKNEVRGVRNTVISVSYDGINAFTIGRFKQFDILSSESLILPVDECSKNLILKIKKDFLKFQDIEKELTFGNGLFVWNQNKEFLSSDSKDNYPIIYANYIVNNSFKFDERKNDIKKEAARRPFCSPNNKCKSFVCEGKKLIIKRTSGIENFLRIKACIISDDFLMKYPKYYLENHINFLYYKKDKNKAIPIKKQLYISAFLSSDIANFIFKLTNGNTQVSATELNELPFVYRRETEIVSLMKKKSIDFDKINELFFEIFELSEQEIQTIKKYKEGFSK